MSLAKRRLFFSLMFRMFPAGRLMCIKRRILRLCGVEIGRDCQVYPGVSFWGAGRIVIEDGVVIRGDVRIESNGIVRIGAQSELNHLTYIAANGDSSVIIGDHTRIAHFVSIKTTTHAIAPTGICIAGEDDYKDIKIGSGAWICAGAIILPGVEIANKSIVAAGAVVTRSLGRGLLAGCPAVIKKCYD